MAGKGGAWKVAYADFVTAMMAFFLVMWITGQSKPVKEAVAEYFENPLGTGKGNRSTSLIGIHDSLTVGKYDKGRGAGSGLVASDLKSSAEQSENGSAGEVPPHVALFRNDARYRSVGTGLRFEEASAELDNYSSERLFLLAILLIEKTGLVEIQAYYPRDDLPEGSKFNDPAELCFARCQTIRKFLVDNGVEIGRIRFKIDGEQDPLTSPQAFGSEKDISQAQGKPYNVFVYAVGWVNGQ